MIKLMRPIWLLVLQTLACAVSSGQATTNDPVDTSAPLRSEQIVPVFGLVTFLMRLNYAGLP